jgi:hypothetical protein
VTGMRAADGTSIDRANPGNLVVLETRPSLDVPTVHSILRKQLSLS